MDQNSKKLVISPKYKTQKTITILSPNIDDSSTFSKHAGSSQSLVTPEKDNTSSNVTTLIDENNKIRV